VLKDLKRRGVQRVRIFITDDLPGLEEAIKKIFPEADWQLCVLHAVRDALNKSRKKDRDALAEDLKKIYRAESQKEAEEALRSLRERWGTVYPKIVERWETKAYALLAFLRHPKPIRRYLYTTNQLERLAKEVKRRTNGVEVFCNEDAAEKLLYLVLSQLDEAWGARGLGDLRKSGWEATMLTRHSRRYTMKNWQKSCAGFVLEVAKRIPKRGRSVPSQSRKLEGQTGPFGLLPG
jgi:transposase-like protein